MYVCRRYTDQTLSASHGRRGRRRVLQMTRLSYESLLDRRVFPSSSNVFIFDDRRRRTERTSRLEAADDDVVDFMVSDLLVATSTKRADVMQTRTFRDAQQTALVRLLVALTCHGTRTAGNRCSTFIFSINT